MAEKKKNKPTQKADELAKQGMLGNEDASRALAKQFGMDVVEDLSLYRLSKDVYKRVPYSFAKKHLIIPILEEGERYRVAVADPLSLEALEEIRLMLDSDVQAVYSPKESILLAINACYNFEDDAASQALADLHKDAEEGLFDGELEVYDLLDQRPGQAPIVKLINLILSEAIQQGASDVHFEPMEDGLRVRYRIDGVLQLRHLPASEYQAQLLTRLKVMAKLDIAERRLPQDGRIKLKMGPREIDFRVSTVPIVGGERVVLRILDRGNVVLGLNQIGMLSDAYREFEKLIALPEGIILVTGPTGSGKTTTLYSSIYDLYNDEINIMTIEDPVEYNLKGIAQIGVRPKIKLTFAAGLRHILRQDPDVIMIGEIRDRETAEIAIQSSLTGHLVMSTLHTNDAPSAITRLVDMGIEPYLLSSTVVGVMAQRLVRKVCPKCKEPYEVTDEELKSIGLKRDELIKGALFQGKGCHYCFNSGYKGRHGIYELMKIDDKLRQQIVVSPDALQLRKLALENGMVSLLAHGAFLVKNGITTISEVLRVTRGIE